MDSNSSSYLLLVATVILLAIVFFFSSGMKRKPKAESTETRFNEKGSEIVPFEIRTTHFSQLLIILCLPLLLAIPVLVFKDAQPTSYFVTILVLLVSIVSWFIAAQNALNRERDDEK